MKNSNLQQLGLSLFLVLVCALTGCKEESSSAGAVVEADAKAAVAAQVQSSEWSEYIAPFAGLGDELASNLADPEDSQERHELYEYIFQQIASGYAMLFYEDPKNPDWWPLFSTAVDALWTNPDTVYYYAVVDSAGTYHLSGNRGKALLADLQLGGGQFVTEGIITQGGMGKIPANIPLDSLDLDENGNFDLIVSPERPEGYSGNWVAMTPDTTYFLIRQVSYDWTVPQANVAIERLDIPARGSRPTEEELTQRLKQLSVWTKNWINLAYNIGRKDRAKSEGAGGFVLVDWLESAFGDQKYYVYAYNLADDEAIIVENEVPEGCSYWSYQLVTQSWRAINPLKHISSLNPVSGRVDSDGKFRAVIADSDPGVRNWLDVGGHKRALVYARFKGCDPKEVPGARVVKLAEVKDNLPEETPDFTEADRDKMMRERARADQMRRRW